MKTLLLITISTLLSACGGASGTGASGSPINTALPASNLHVYTMEVTANDLDFTFAPVINGTNMNANSPGPQTVLGVGNTLTYNLTDTQADVQITGVSATNGAFHATVVVLKDGVQVATWPLGVGVSWDTGAI